MLFAYILLYFRFKFRCKCQTFAPYGVTDNCIKITLLRVSKPSLKVCVYESTFASKNISETKSTFIRFTSKIFNEILYFLNHAL